jgi:menaquinone-dependent protoporphyrinogen oxidase
VKVLVSVATRHGATRQIADCIAEELEGLGLRAHVLDPELVFDLTGYDAVVLGSAVYAGRWLPAARKLVDRTEADLRRVPVWLLSSGPIGDPAKPTIPPADALETTRRIGARDHQLFEGKLDRNQLGMAERAIVRVVGAKSGDYRQWPAIAAWGRSIADALKAEAAPAEATTGGEAATERDAAPAAAFR